MNKDNGKVRASNWPTLDAMANDPIVAEKMNSLPKIVFSNKLTSVGWQNTSLAKNKRNSSWQKLF